MKIPRDLLSVYIVGFLILILELALGADRVALFVLTLIVLVAHLTPREP